MKSQFLQYSAFTLSGRLLKMSLVGQKCGKQKYCCIMALYGAIMKMLLMKGFISVLRMFYKVAPICSVGGILAIRPAQQLVSNMLRSRWVGGEGRAIGRPSAPPPPLTLPLPLLPPAPFHYTVVLYSSFGLHMA